MSKKSTRVRRSFTPQFKRDAVAIVSIDEQTDAVDAVRAEMPSVRS
jgi:transposase-like protein